MPHSDRHILLESLKQHELSEFIELAKSTFRAAFMEGNTSANLSKYIAKNFAYAQVKSEFDHPDSIFIVAKVGERMIGYLKLNEKDAQTESGFPDSLEIERIYVRPAYLGKGVGKRLYEKAHSIALKNDASYIWLGVWEKNERAIAFYKKMGFKIFAEHPFMMGNEEQKDYLMRLEL